MSVEIPDQRETGEAPEVSMTKAMNLITEASVLAIQVDGRTMEDWAQVHHSHRITSTYAALDRVETLLLRALGEVREQRDLALDWDPV